MNSDSGISNKMAWGVEELDAPSRIALAVNTGVDIISGSLDVFAAREAYERGRNGYYTAQGHPVLGDPVYNGLRKGFPELAGQCLHARRLSFQHPRTGERMTLSSPLPAYFQTVLTRCSRLV